MCTEVKFGKDVSLSYQELEGIETEIREWFEDVMMGAQKKDSTNSRYGDTLDLSCTINR